MFCVGRKVADFDNFLFVLAPTNVAKKERKKYML
jgi:hypothetical protein